MHSVSFRHSSSVAIPGANGFGLFFFSFSRLLPFLFMLRLHLHVVGPTALLLFLPEGLTCQSSLCYRASRINERGKPLHCGKIRSANVQHNFGEPNILAEQRKNAATVT